MSQRTSTILELVSAAAVVLSLIFVAFEIRNSSEQVTQNTQALQVTAYQDLIGRIAELNAIGGRTSDPCFEGSLRRQETIHAPILTGRAFSSRKPGN